jgi:hypothetical protein
VANLPFKHEAFWIRRQVASQRLTRYWTLQTFDGPIHVFNRQTSAVILDRVNLPCSQIRKQAREVTEVWQRIANVDIAPSPGHSVATITSGLDLVHRINLGCSFFPTFSV